MNNIKAELQLIASFNEILQRLNRVRDKSMLRLRAAYRAASPEERKEVDIEIDRVLGDDGAEAFYVHHFVDGMKDAEPLPPPFKATEDAADQGLLDDMERHKRGLI